MYYNFNRSANAILANEYATFTEKRLEAAIISELRLYRPLLWRWLIVRAPL